MALESSYTIVYDLYNAFGNKSSEQITIPALSEHDAQTKFFTEVNSLTVNIISIKRG